MAVARAIPRSQPSAAAIYVRISDDREGDELGVKRQQKDCDALAKRKGWPVARVFVDNDISAWKGQRRQQYSAMLAAIREGDIDAVVVWHLDRLHRSPKELEQFFDACDAAGVAHLATVTGDIDLATHQGRLHARLMGSVAKYESDHKSFRIRRKHDELAQAGKGSGGGTRPFGYEDDRVTIRASEARLIRDAAKRVLAGESLRSICREWNAKKVATSAGQPWYASALQRVLRSGRIAGWREHHRELIAKAQWPGIITIAESRRLRSLLMDPSRRLNAGARRYLLTGILRCGLCGTSLVARPRDDKRRCYVCATDPRRPTACGKIRRLSDPVEELVTAMVFEAVDTKRLARAIEERHRKDRKSGKGDALSIIEDGENELEQLASDLGGGRITRREWLAARAPLQRRLDVARSALAAEQKTTPLSGYLSKAGALRRAWPSLSTEKQRAIVAAVIDHVTLEPALRGRNTFDPTLVKVTWRY
jgi:site-specific DNA recombinase